MKQMKKVLMVIILVLTIGGTFTTVTYANPKFNKTSVKLKKKKTAKIKIKGLSKKQKKWKWSFSTSDKSVVTVKASSKNACKVKAKKKNGYAVVKATSHKVTYYSLIKVGNGGKPTYTKKTEDWAKKGKLHLPAIKKKGVTPAPEPETESTVNIDSIVLSEENLTLKIGDTKKLSVSITPSNATNTRLEWKSSDPNIATVSSGGVITGISAGETSIFVNSTDGNFTYASCKVIVEHVYTIVDLTMANWNTYIEKVDIPFYYLNAFGELKDLDIHNSFVIKQQYMNSLDIDKSSVALKVSYKIADFNAKVDLSNRTYQLLSLDFVYGGGPYSKVVEFIDMDYSYYTDIPIPYNRRYFGDSFENAYGNGANFETISSFPIDISVTQVTGKLYMIVK